MAYDFKPINSIDQQLKTLPTDIQFCKKCVVSNQRPRTTFNEEGVCSACQWSYEKDHVIDWKSREAELADLCDKHRSKNGAFDVILPSSGGKDSAFVAHQLKTRFNMHPLCVTWAPFAWTETGFRNLTAFNKAGFTNIICQVNGSLHRKLAKAAFMALGDAWQPFTFGQKSWAFHMAEKFNISLIFYGENGEVEYGGDTRYKNTPKEDSKLWKEHHNKGIQVRDLIDFGQSQGFIQKNEFCDSEIDLYEAIPYDIIEEKKIEMHWHSYYCKWIPHENFFYAAKHTGFETNQYGRTESTYTKYASLDDKADGFHFYLGYMKFGLGRATRDAMQDVRRQHITREEAVSLVKLYDHEFPKRYYQWFLDYLEINDDFFWQVMNHYRSASNAWKYSNGEWTLKARVT